MLASTRARVSGRTGTAPVTTFETVRCETPACAATSRIVTAMTTSLPGRILAAGDRWWNATKQFVPAPAEGAPRDDRPPPRVPAPAAGARALAQPQRPLGLRDRPRRLRAR